ncbi:MAG TPA: hypothetical protein VFN95_15785, partial [Flavitalea sp.]|nr:hypothetical protein [Flavitalea sp.]
NAKNRLTYIVFRPHYTTHLENEPYRIKKAAKCTLRFPGLIWIEQQGVKFAFTADNFQLLNSVYPQLPL